MRFFRTLSFAALAMLFSLAGCRKGAGDVRVLTPEQEERVAAVVEWTSQGAVSRDGHIEIHFTTPWASDEEVGKPSDGKWLDVSPDIGGKLWWRDGKTLVFDADKELEPGVVHHALLDLPGLTGDTSLPAYPFSFIAAPRTAVLAPESFSRNGDKASAAISVAFSDPPSDTSNASRTEAEQDGRTLAASWAWTGSMSARVTIDGIRLDGGAVSLRLPARKGGVDEEASVELEMPGLAGGAYPVWVGPFAEGGSEGFRVLLSDPPSDPSDLQGFLDVPGVEGVRHELDGSMAKVSWPERGKPVRLVVALAKRPAKTVTWEFRGRKPDVHWSEEGSILTSRSQDRVHFEAVNLERVRVRVSRVSAGNVPEFLANRSLADASGWGSRPGRLVWNRVITLQARRDVPIQGAIDLHSVLGAQGAGLYTIELLREREGMLYRCDEPSANAGPEPVEREEDEEGEEGGDPEGNGYQHRENPCKNAYWRDWWAPVARRNVIVSDIGLMAWREPQGRIVAVATDLLTAKPWKGVEIEALEADDRVVSSAKTSGEGFAELSGKTASILHARGERDGREMHAWLRLGEGDARNLSRFDVGGQVAPDGIRLFPWTERGVYRPGDSIFVGCLVRGPDGREMDRLPLRLVLRDPRGRVAASSVSRAAPDGMFSWRLPTSVDDPTGRWSLVVEAGPASRELPVLVETVRPNRLKIEVVSPKVIGKGAEKGRIRLSSHWLSGGSAAGLRAQVQASLSPAPFSPKGFADFEFTDPTRPGPGSEETENVIWEGALDGSGGAEFSLGAPDASEASGMVQASLRTRVFEPGGQASVDRFAVSLSPFTSYAGVHLRTKSSWGWVESGSSIGIDAVSVTPLGAKIGDAKLKVEVWRHPETWWWEEGDQVRGFLARDGVEKVWEGEARSGGSVNYTPESEGRHVVLVRDPSGHVAGSSLNVWSGWGGSSRQGPGAQPSLLTLQAERDTVEPGGRIGIGFPSSKGGKALVQILDGRRILSQTWISTEDDRTNWSGKVPQAARGGLYAMVTLLQPYPPSTDRPLRMWGVVPIALVDPASRLRPEIQAPAELRPLAKARVKIRERDGKPMRAMLALVDEGLLDLTRFRTPDPWSAFHGRSALQVRGWDLHDLVVGAWAGRTDRLFAVGGSEDARAKASQSKGNPFPPLVIVKGPFDVPKGGSDIELDIPRYTGSVRLMVVAAKDHSFGSAEKAVPVRAPVMALLTVPRALSPSDQATVSVTVFASKPGPVRVRMALSGPIVAEGATVATADFKSPGDQVVSFRIRATSGVGEASVSVDATSPAGKGSDAQGFQVRHPGAPGTRGTLLVANDSLGWTVPIAPWGIPGTRTTRLEISTGLIGVQDRIDDLIQYPHGCLEQTLSGLVPQIFLRTLVPWTPELRLKEADRNVKAGIARLRRFQTPSGGLSLWPGEGEPYPWGTVWAARGMLAAREAGFDVPPSLLDPVLAWIADRSRGFRPGSEATRGDTLLQVSRLDILALANKPDLAAMNRLREAPLGDLERWTLAAAYASAGRADVARHLSARAGTSVTQERMMIHNLNSPVRDRSLMAEAMFRAGNRPKGEAMIRGLRDEIRDVSRWYSTQELGTTLWAMARFQTSPAKTEFQARWRIDQGAWNTLRVAGGSGKVDLPPDVAGRLEVKLDGRSAATAFLSQRAIPGADDPAPDANGLELSITHERSDGTPISPSSVAQGEDFRVVATITNVSGRTLPNVALVQIFPGGWEIRNETLEGAETNTAQVDNRGWGRIQPRRVEIRDDRALHYLDLPEGTSARVVVGVRAAYAGAYLCPGAHVEALYDATYQATEPAGRCVVEPR